METNKSTEISEEVLYGVRSKFWRCSEMVLCFICLVLTVIFWVSPHVLMVVLVLYFATAFGFFMITLLDVIAGMKHKQYTKPAWVAFAFLGAFMFFLSFGLLAPQPSILPKYISAVCFITGFVFLIDGILIVTQYFKLNLPIKVRPASEQEVRRTADSSTQVYEEKEEVSEVPVEMRTYAPRAAAQAKKTSQATTFPITSYGGTFPVGAKDEAPLPTPDKLTGLEPDKTSQLHVPKKQAKDVSHHELYPPLEDPVEKPAYSSPDITQAFEEFVRNAEAAKTFAEKKRDSYPKDIYMQVRQGHIQTESMIPYHQTTPTDSAAPLTPPMMVKPQTSRFPQETLPRSVQTEACRICCLRQLDDPREQVTPFVTHHFDQSPCICGYTHYQASTVIKGAVRQNPQDSVRDQQRMIQDQLEQMRRTCKHHACTCHDLPVEQMRRSWPHHKDSVGDSKGTSSTYRPNNRRISEELTKLQKPGTLENLMVEENWKETRSRLSPDSDRKVTIGTSDLFPPSPNNEHSHSMESNGSRDTESPKRRSVSEEILYRKQLESLSKEQNKPRESWVAKKIDLMNQLEASQKAINEKEIYRSREDSLESDVDQMREFLKKTGIGVQNPEQRDSIDSGGKPDYLKELIDAQRETDSKTSYKSWMDNKNDDAETSLGPKKIMDSLEVLTSKKSSITPRKNWQFKARSGQETSEPDSRSLPRMLHPIEEQRMREGITVSESEDFRSHIPDLVLMKQLDCRCVCKCICPKGAPKNFNNLPLYHAPYPKNDGALGYTKEASTSEIDYSDEAILMGRQMILDNMPRRSSLKRELNPGEMPREKMSVTITMPKKEDQEECPPECSSCPVRRERKRKLAESHKNIYNRNDEENQQGRF